MDRFGKLVKRGIKVLFAMAAAGLFVSVALWGCGESALEVGDEVNVPPLPPADALIGLFEKVESSDLTGNTYKLRDLPENGVGEPTGLFFDDRYRLFFYYNDAIRIGTVRPASYYITTGADGVADSGLGIDDDQINPVGTDGLDGADIVVGPGPDSVLEASAAGNDEVVSAIVPGSDGVLDSVTLCDAADSVSNDGNYCLPGDDGVLDTIAADAIGRVILAGVDRQADSTVNIGSDDIQENSGYLDEHRDVVVGPGPDGYLATSPVGDDEVVWAVVPSPDGALQSTCHSDDYTSNDGKYCLPAENRILDTTPDSVGEVILSGTDDVADSGLGAGEIQGEFKLWHKNSDNFGDDDYITFTGIPVGRGEPNRKAVGPGDNGLIDTACVYDDNTRSIYDLTFPPLKLTKIIRTDNTDGIYTGMDGIAQSGLGGDDVQVILSGETVATDERVILVHGGENGVLETIIIGADDIQEIEPGTTDLGKKDVVVSAGPNSAFETCPQGDDYIGYKVTDHTALQILSGDNKRADTVALSGDDRIVIAGGAGDGANETVEYGLAEGEKQIASAYNRVPMTFPIVAARQAGPDVDIITPRRGDDVEMVYNFTIGWPLGSGALGEAVTVAQGDDIQVIPVGFPSFVPAIPAFFPVILPGPNGTIESDIATSETLVIGEYGPAGVIDALLVAAGYSAVGAPPGNGIAESGLAGRGILDVFIPSTLGGGMCANVLDNGGIPFVDDPFTGNPPYSQCMPRTETCSDDAQVKMYGESVTSGDVIIDSCFNEVLDTTRLEGDSEAIIDGGNGVSDSGIGGDDDQLIPAGQGQPYAVSIIASRTSSMGNGAERTLLAPLVGDDVEVDPVEINPELAGDEIIDSDDVNTEVDPDGDGIVENYATVDDGEYFSWIDTDIAIPTSEINVLKDFGIIESNFTYHIFVDPSDSGRLIGFVSNGKEIYRIESTDGENWSSTTEARLVLPSGGNGSENDPVVLAGVDGICDTAAHEDDVQAISVGEGRPDSIAIFAGKNGVLESVSGGDDEIKYLHEIDDEIEECNPEEDPECLPMFILTGDNGINESIATGDDWGIIPTGQGQPDSACVVAGANGVRDTDVSIAADDRPPFLDKNGNSGQLGFYLPEAGEPSVGEGEPAGFDALAVTSPFIYIHEGIWYMFYSGWGALSEPIGRRPDADSWKGAGPCMRPGLDRDIFAGNLSNVVNNDNTPGAAVAPRIGLAVSSDNGETWVRQNTPIIGLSDGCAAFGGLSLGEDIDIPEEMGEMDFDYSGVFNPRARADEAADGEPVFSIFYTGLQFKRDNNELHPNTGRERFDGFKTGVGLARSFDIETGWAKLTDYNPVFSGAGLSGGNETEETTLTLLEMEEGYLAYYAEHDLDIDETYISVAHRSGTIYSLCMTIDRVIPGSSHGRAVVGLLLILLPAVLLFTRKVWLKTKNRR